MFVVKNDEEEGDLRIWSKNRIKRVLAFSVVKEGDIIGKLDHWLLNATNELYAIKKVIFLYKLKIYLLQGLVVAKNIWRLIVKRKLTENEIKDFYEWTIEDIEEYRKQTIEKLAHI